MHVDDLRFRFEAVFPNALKQHGSGHGLTGVSNQELKQAEFARQQRDLDVRAFLRSGLISSPPNRQPAKSYPALTPPAYDGFKPRQQFQERRAWRYNHHPRRASLRPGHQHRSKPSKMTAGVIIRCARKAVIMLMPSPPGSMRSMMSTSKRRVLQARVHRRNQARFVPPDRISTSRTRTLRPSRSSSITRFFKTPSLIGSVR